MTLTTRFTRALRIEHPVVLAPMDEVSDARLAGAVSASGGLGLLGGGYADEQWVRRQFAAAEQAVGCGFITWTLRGNEHVLDYVLDQRPAAIFLSFGDPEPYAAKIRDAGVPLLCQVHDVEQAARVLDVGADVVVAQGGEAGGHGTGQRGTFTLVPEVADLLAQRAPDVLLLAAGGVTDGRGLAAALALGADGVVVGTRLWASHEAAVSTASQKWALAATGDDTVRQHAFDVVREKAWPSTFNGRVLRNQFVTRWSGRDDELRSDLAAQRALFDHAVTDEDYTTANVIVGEGIGRIDRIDTAASIVATMVHDAAQLLGRPPAGPAGTTPSANDDGVPS